GTPMAIVAATTSKTTPNSPALRAAYVADGQGGMAVRQTTEADNNKEQVWNENPTESCFINTLN
ncbi:MAG: hypothetical protein MI742_07780, partial [Desulfobacterales bacterium]|nr:hypothetical protein [Desulfobacterales bacterium]